MRTVVLVVRQGADMIALPSAKGVAVGELALPTTAIQHEVAVAVAQGCM